MKVWNGGQSWTTISDVKPGAWRSLHFLLCWPLKFIKLSGFFFPVLKNEVRLGHTLQDSTLQDAHDSGQNILHRQTDRQTKDSNFSSKKSKVILVYILQTSIYSVDTRTLVFDSQDMEWSPELFQQSFYMVGQGCSLTRNSAVMDSALQWWLFHTLLQRDGIFPRCLALGLK